MKKINLIYSFLFATTLVAGSYNLELFNKSFHAQGDAGKALNDFLNSEKVEKFILNEHKNEITIELKDGSVLNVVLIKHPLGVEYFFSPKENFEIMKSRTSLEDLGSGNF